MERTNSCLNVNYAKKELHPHGTHDFPCAGYILRYREGESEGDIPWHWHPEMELVYVEKGDVRLQLPGKTYNLKEKQCFAINSNILHYVSAAPCCEFHSIVFSPILIAGGENSVYGTRYMTPLTLCPSFDGCLLQSEGEMNPVFNFVSAFGALRTELPGYEFKVRENLSLICFMLFQAYEQNIKTAEGKSEKNNYRIRKMIDYIHKHFSETLELAAIAKAADIGERECLRCFQKEIQISPMQYLLKYRVTQGAALLLQYPNASISDISSQCGFESPSNFSQTFKRFYNASPRDYRKNRVADC